MSDMHYVELVIKIPEQDFRKICANKEDSIIAHDTCRRIANGTLVPKGHGRVVDVGKIDKDRIDHDNPIIYLTMNGEYIEAVSLDYINNLTTIIEADKEESEDKECR